MTDNSWMCKEETKVKLTQGSFGNDFVDQYGSKWGCVGMHPYPREGDDIFVFIANDGKSTMRTFYADGQNVGGANPYKIVGEYKEPRTRSELMEDAAGYLGRYKQVIKANQCRDMESAEYQEAEFAIKDIEKLLAEYDKTFGSESDDE